ncbi:MAG: hypothetical protein AAF664_21075 [Planctomycetota bacterium]
MFEGTNSESRDQPASDDKLARYVSRFDLECRRYREKLRKRYEQRGVTFTERDLTSIAASRVCRRLADELIEAGLATKEEAMLVMEDTIDQSLPTFLREWRKELKG